MQLAEKALLLDEAGGFAKFLGERGIETVKDAHGVVFAQPTQLLATQLFQLGTRAAPGLDPLLLLLPGGRTHIPNLTRSACVGQRKGVEQSKGSKGSVDWDGGRHGAN